MTSLDPATESDSRVAAVAKALVPLLAGAVAGWVLQQAGADAQIAQLASAAVTAVVGTLLVRRATSQDEQRAAAHTPSTPPHPSPSSGTGQAPASPRLSIRPSHSTVALWAVLAAAGFWLIDLVTTWVGLGSLGYWSSEIPDDPSVFYRTVALRSLPLFAPAVFLVAVAIAHRLRERGRSALTSAALIYTIAVLVTNQVLARHWNTEPLPEDLYLPLLFGACAWLICRLACWYAGRTQDRFDASRAARIHLRADSGRTDDQL